ncbi:uncharacterized protein [Typha latifolia]|uniref:uncharacterized protein n=1 Tax=Typha latifolia TaxID=4733 RepID=UPI003C2F0F96
MEDVLTETPPPSRFFQEDLDNFFTPSPPLPSPFLLLNPNLNPNTNPSLLVIAISAPSLSLLHLIPSKTLIGTLILPEIPLSGNSLAPSPGDKSCNLYAVDRSPAPTVLAAVQFPVAAERSCAVARTLLGGIHADRVVILDSIRSLNYRGKLAVDETLVFKLETSKQRSSGDPVLKEVEYLPSGSVMDGLGAAILAECQMRKVKGTMLATWPENRGLPVTTILRSVFRDLGFDVRGIEGESGFSAGFKVSSHIDSVLYT